MLTCVQFMHRIRTYILTVDRYFHNTLLGMIWPFLVEFASGARLVRFGIGNWAEPLVRDTHVITIMLWFSCQGTGDQSGTGWIPGNLHQWRISIRLPVYLCLMYPPSHRSMYGLYIGWLIQVRTCVHQETHKGLIRCPFPLPSWDGGSCSALYFDGCDCSWPVFQPWKSCLHC